VKYAVGSLMWDRCNNGGGKAFTYDINEVRGDYGLTHSQMCQVMEELRASGEVEGLTANGEGGEFTVRFKPYDREQAAPARKPEPMIDDEINIIYARHVLWMHGLGGGERADFTGQELRELNMIHMHLSGASFAGAVIENCCLDESRFTNCDFTGATLRNTSVYNAEFAGARFEDADIADCSFRDGWCMGAGFSGARITGCDFTNVDLDGADFSQAEITECTGLDEISRGPAMAMEGV